MAYPAHPYSREFNVRGLRVRVGYWWTTEDTLGSGPSFAVVFPDSNGNASHVDAYQRSAGPSNLQTEGGARKFLEHWLPEVNQGIKRKLERMGQAEAQDTEDMDEVTAELVRLIMSLRVEGEELVLPD